MRIDRRLTFIGVMLIVLSMTMATQYATTKVSYTFGIVHPSNADIRFVGSDNSSNGTTGFRGRLLNVTGNSSATSYAVSLKLGDWMPNSEKNYTAAFAIVNEEGFKVNITHINVSGTGAASISIYLHGNRSKDATSETGGRSWNCSVKSGVSWYKTAVPQWILGAGDGDPATMNGSAVATRINTTWDTNAHVRYNDTTVRYANNGTSDYVWVQISISTPSDQDIATYTGQIWIHFKATTKT